jgi:uncharacterized membrane protein (UPF0182 family)
MRFRFVVFGILFFILMFSSQIVYFLTEWRWFGNLGYSSVYATILSARMTLFLVVAALFAVLSMVNLRFIKDRPKYIGWAVFFISILFGIVTQFGWETFLLFLNAKSFNVLDPLYHNDIGFYVFTLPFILFIWMVIFGTVLANLLMTAAIYLSYLDFSQFQDELQHFSELISERAQAHIAVLLAILAFLLAIRYHLARYDLLYSEEGVVYGAGYTDVYAQLPMLNLYSGVAILVAVLLILFAVKIRSPRILLLMGLVVIATGLLGTIYPAVIQQYRVSPNEIVMEEPFIAHNINYTLNAYGLHDIGETSFPVEYTLTGEDVVANSATIDNIRLWDWRPLLRTYEQLQEIRLYYDFLDVDVDRYFIDGTKRQVLLSPRELSQDKLPAQARTWVNQHLVYTHGYGICMSPANEVTEEGMPEFYIKNLPPESEIGNIKRPEIYYGEGDKDYVVVNTKLNEFDYPKGDENVYTTYAGSGGVELDTLYKLMMTYRLASLKLLVTDYITEDSRIMIHRNILDRASTIAPFLAYDGDPYMVFADGRLYWIMDAYTLTDRYPYSEPMGRFNYIRNPVKVTVDAYNGSIRYYVLKADPILDAYMAIFPELFMPVESMPSELIRHIRYPLDLFEIQASIYRHYHMQDPQVFYNKEDAWDIPDEIYEEGKQKMEPYYVIMRPPGCLEEEFILMQPFTPYSKDNMVAWMCARSDQPNYGDLNVFKFPKDQLIFGPMQIEARINQDTTISQQLTLWSQKGSRVIRGNLLVIPINSSLLYVEPLYLRAENSELPELKRVIVVYGGKVAMEETLDLALAQIFGTEAAATVSERAELNIEDLILQAQRHYEDAQAYLREGNWSGYGDEIEVLGQVLEELAGRSEVS